MTFEHLVYRALFAIPSLRRLCDISVEVCVNGEYVAITGVVMRPEADTLTILTKPAVGEQTE